MILAIVQLFWYIIKLLLYCLAGIFYFMAAAVVRLFDMWKAKSVFLNYLHLYFKIFGLRVHYEFANEKTREASNTVFVLLNQCSFLDSLIIPALPIRKTRGIINIEFAFYPVIGWFIAMNNFVIIRQWSYQAKKVINRTRKFLSSGGNMIISIEGKRSKNGKLNEYKKGPVVMAINNQSEIVPLIIEGSYESLPYGSLYTKPGDIRVRILDPIPTRGLTYDHRDDLRDELRSIAHTHGLD